MSRIDPLDALLPRDQTWLVHICEVLGVRPETWDRIPLLVGTVEVLAVEAEADRVQEAAGSARLPARQAAAASLGVAWETHRTRLKDALSYSMDPRRGRRSDFHLPRQAG